MRALLLALAMLGLAGAVDGQVLVDGKLPQLPSELGPNGGLKVECIAGTCTGSGGVGAAVDISSVGGNVITTTVPVSGTVSFSNTSLAVTGTFWQATQPVSHANFANLDAALSTLATQATLALIKAKTDNLDVLLSTRTKPADAQHAIIDSGAVTFSNTTIAVTNAGTFATQATQAGTWNIGSITTLPAITGTVTATLAAGSAVIGHTITDTGSTTAVSNGVTAGLAGSPSTDVITVQGTSGMVPIINSQASKLAAVWWMRCSAVRRTLCQ